jgi:hypothetical protein
MFGKLKQIQARMLMGPLVIPGREQRERTRNPEMISSRFRVWYGASHRAAQIADPVGPSRNDEHLPHPGALAALALHNGIALLDQALALAILA